jgi:hypothetical protein
MDRSTISSGTAHIHHVRRVSTASNVCVGLSTVPISSCHRGGVLHLKKFQQRSSNSSDQNEQQIKYPLPGERVLIQDGTVPIISEKAMAFIGRKVDLQYAKRMTTQQRHSTPVV